MSPAATPKCFSFRLDLRHRFTISRSSSVYRKNVFCPIVVDGGVHWGEGAPNMHYSETVEGCADVLEDWRASIPSSPFAIEPFLQAMRRRAAGNWSALAALDMAVFDWFGRYLNAPLYRIFGLDPASIPPTSMTIGIGEVSTMPARVREAEGFEVLKIKLGTDHDRDIIEAIRQATDQRIRVDINEGWTNREQAIREIEWLARHNVELIEQPMPASQWEDSIWLRDRSPLPLIADESVRLPEDVLPSAEAFHGINIKLAKCGGILPAREMIVLARQAGLQIMVGCMVETSLGIAAAAQLAPLVDYVDLDGNLLVSNDPFDGHPVVDGRIVLNDRPGLGVEPKDEAFQT